MRSNLLQVLLLLVCMTLPPVWSMPTGSRVPPANFIIMRKGNQGCSERQNLQIRAILGDIFVMVTAAHKMYSKPNPGLYRTIAWQMNGDPLDPNDAENRRTARLQNIWKPLYKAFSSEWAEDVFDIKYNYDRPDTFLMKCSPMQQRALEFTHTEEGARQGAFHYISLGLLFFQPNPSLQTTIADMDKSIFPMPTSSLMLLDLLLGDPHFMGALGVAPLQRLSIVAPNGSLLYGLEYVHMLAPSQSRNALAWSHSMVALTACHWMKANYRKRLKSSKPFINLPPPPPLRPQQSSSRHAKDHRHPGPELEELLSSDSEPEDLDYRKAQRLLHPAARTS